MTQPYPYETISINGREVSIQQICARTATAENDFESDTFSFIADWFENFENFTLTTSGSTGSPKAVIITRKQMISSAGMTASALQLKAGTSALLCLSPAFIAGKMMLVRCFSVGIRIVAVDPSANPFRTIPAQLKIDFAALVPLQVHDILRSEQAGQLARVRCVIVGGAPLDAESLSMLQQCPCQFYATYGMTETVSHIALRPLNGVHRADYFTTLPGITVKTDERQCLVISWDALPHPMITNDVVEITGTDTFRWLGRWDNVINTGGVKVIPEVVEEKIRSLFQGTALTVEFFVSSIPDSKLGNKVVLVIQGAKDGVALKDLSVKFQQILSRHENPKEIRSVPTFVRTENGKVNRKATLALSNALLDSTA